VTPHHHPSQGRRHEIESGVGGQCIGRWGVNKNSVKTLKFDVPPLPHPKAYAWTAGRGLEQLNQLYLTHIARMV